MAEETTLDTAIPPIGWQEGERDSTDSQLRRQTTKKKKPAPKKRPKTGRPQPAAGTGTRIDVTV